jgi:Flp pilus assembly protein TadG
MKKMLFRTKRQQGQTMTEFALVLPLLALLLFGVIQFGIVFHQYVTLTDAVRAAARQGAVSRLVSNPEDAVEDRVREAASGLDQAKLDVDVDFEPALEKGADVTVTATYPYRIRLFGIPLKEGELTSTTTERVE